MRKIYTASVYLLSLLTVLILSFNTSNAQTCSSGPLAGGVYTINPSSPTGGTNFNSLSDAALALKCGITDSVSFMVSGTAVFTQPLKIDTIAGVSNVKKVRFYGNGATISYNTTSSTDRSAVILNGADHVVLDGFNINVSAGTYGWGVLLMNAADSNIIRNCTITSNTSSTSSNYAGVMINGSASSTSSSGNNGNGNIIENNTINGGYYGVYLYGSTSEYNVNNVVRNNIINDFYYYSIYSYGQKNGIISKNDISRPTRTSASGYNLYLSTNGGGNLIEKNKVHDPFTNVSSPGTYYNIYLNKGASGNPNKVQNNLVYNIKGSNSSIYGIYGTTLDNVEIYHNTVVLDDVNSTAGATYGIYAYSTSNLYVKNNIVYITRGGSGTKYNLYFSSTGVTESNNNVLYMGSTAGTNNIGYYSSAKSTFADWQATGYDANSVSADPMFSGPGNYIPTNAAINNIGASGLGVLTDLNDVARSVSPDPGVYEFTIAGVDAALSWVSPASPLSAGTYPITVKVSNVATVPITSINLTYTDGVIMEMQNFTGLNIAPGASQNLTFTNPYNLTHNSTITAYINLVNNTNDMSTTNDTTQNNLCFSLKGNYTINQFMPASATNFTSFSALGDALTCGGVDSAVVVTVDMGSGPYNDRLIIGEINGSSATNTITIYGNGETISYNTSSSTDRAAVILNGSDHVIIDSLNIDVSAGTYGWGIVLSNRADSNTIKRSTIFTSTSATTSNYAGIVINGSAAATGGSGNNGNGNIIENNTIIGGYYGIYLYGSTSEYNENNIVRNNKIEDYYYYSIYSYGQMNGVISKNNMYRPNRTNASNYNLYLSTNGGGNLIEKNILHDIYPNVSSPSTTYGFYLNKGVAGNPNKIYNNLIYNILGSSGTIYGMYGLSIDYTNIYHNTIVLDDANSTAGTTYGMYVYGSNDVFIKNNIIYITRGGTGTKYNLYFSSTGVTKSDNNVLFMNSSAGTNGIGYYSTGYTTLNAWQAAGFDSSSVAADPMFMGGGDYTPTEPSVNNIGDPTVGVTTDITDAIRDSIPDPGAYEFSISGIDAALSWVSPVTPATPGNNTITVTVTNNASATIKSINLTYTDGVVYETQNFTGLNITGGSSQNLSFTTPYNVTGSVNLMAYINLVNNTMDLSQINDTAKTSLCFAMKGNYVINQTMPTSGNVFASFADMQAALNCGGVDSAVVISIAPGTGPYNERLLLDYIPGTSAQNTVTIKGNNEQIVHNATASSERAAVILNGSKFVILDSLIIDVSSGSYGWGIALTGQADSNIIRNSTILTNTSSTSSNYAGIVISGSTTGTGGIGNNGNYNIIENNKITGGYYGVYLYGNTTDYNSGNIIRNNKIEDFYYYSIYSYGQKDGIISKNDFSRPSRTNASAYNVYLSTNGGGNLIEKNTIHDLFMGVSSPSTSYIIYLNSGASGNSNKIYNNLIYNILGSNGSLYGIYGTTAQYTNIYHNTIVLDDPGSTAGATYGIYVSGANELNVKNNLVYINRGGTGSKYNLYYMTTGVTSSDNNILYMGSTSGTNAIGYYNASTYTTLSDWKTGTGYDLNSVSLDPDFENPSVGNFTPTISAANNIGVPLGITTDIRDSVRSATQPDAGAFEFEVLTTGNNMAVEKFISPSESEIGCYTNNEQVSVQIHNLSTSTINFATDSTIVKVYITGPVNQTLSYTVNSGTLASDSTLIVTLNPTVDLSTPGLYTLTAVVKVDGDVNSSNDSISYNITKTPTSAGTINGSSISCANSNIGPILWSQGFSSAQSVQWYSANAASGPYTAISGEDSTLVEISSPITQTMYYSMVATCGTQSDTAYFTVTYSDPQITSVNNGERCGPGTVTLSANGSAGTTIKWYENASGGPVLATGNSFVTPSISSTKQYYVEASTTGMSGQSPIVITEMDLGTDKIEIQNISPFPINVNGWKVALSDSYTDIQSVNTIVKTLSGSLNPGDILFWDDVSSSAQYWGNNIFWNPGSPAWAAILDSNNNLMDIVFVQWNASNIASASITIGSTTINPSTKWNGDGINGTGLPDAQSLSRQGQSDNNAATDFSAINSSLGVTNPGLTVPFSGFGCSSVRQVVTATINNGGPAAGAAGTTECASESLSGSTAFIYTDCDPIATINPSGASPLTGTVQVCVTVDASVQTAPNGEYYVQRHYDITPSAASASATSTITLYYLQSEFNAYNAVNTTGVNLPTGPSDAAGIANLKITQYNGTGTAPGNYTGNAELIDPADAQIVWNSTLNRWEVTFDATGTGGFYVHTGAYVLPVTLISFNGENAGEINKLMWNTSTEQNSKGFEVEKSMDGKAFKTIGYVTTKAENGNSKTALHYNFNDELPYFGNNYYRLKLIDKDGKYSYSNVIRIQNNRSYISISKVYPNPTTNHLNVSIVSTLNQKASIVITDLTGRVVMHFNNMEIIAGEQQQTLNVQSLSSGTYMIKLICNEGCERSVQKFIKR